MIFFAMMFVAALMATAVQLSLGHPFDLPAAMRWGMTPALLFVGIGHFVKPGRYLPMMPSFVPEPRKVILFTGLCEIAGAIGLQVPILERAAGLMLAIYFVCVFPANLKNALATRSIEGLPSARWYYWVRLPFQPVAIVWALAAAEIIRLPGQ
jgi:uncharacterized membrane protein